MRIQFVIISLLLNRGSEGKANTSFAKVVNPFIARLVALENLLEINCNDEEVKKNASARFGGSVNSPAHE